MNIHELFTDRSGIIPNVEILNTYGNSLNLEISKDDLYDFKNTFDETREEKRPNIKVDHSDHQELLRKLLGIEKPDSELPNIGYIDNMRIENDSLIADIVEIPIKLIELLFSGQFKGVSPEFYQNYRGTGKKFIEAVALTNYPRLKHQYNMSEKDSESSSSEFGYSGYINIIDEVTKMSDITKADLEKVESNLFTKFSELFTKKEVTVDEKKTEMSEMKSQIEELKAANAEKDEKLNKFSDAFSIMSNKARADSVDAICSKAVASGVKPATVEHFKPLLLSDLSAGKIKFSDSEGQETEKSVTDYISDFFETQKGQIKFSDNTRTGVEVPGIPELDDRQKAIEEKGKQYFSEFKTQGYTDNEAWSKAIDKAYNIE